MRVLQDVLLWLFVINLGIAFGAGIYEARVVIPPWAHLPRENWPNTGLQFWVYVTTIPLTLLTLANAFVAWKAVGPARAWLAAAVIIIVIERVFTFSYFIPTMIRLSSGEGMPDPETRMALTQWLNWNHLRHLLTLGGWLAALRALVLWGR